MKMALDLVLPEGVDPFANYTTAPSGAKVRLFIKMLKQMIGGGYLGRATAVSRPTLVTGTAFATGTIAPASVQAADTVSFNGQALTAVQHYATGTVTFASATTADTITINGVVFTCTTDFSVAGTDTQDAAAFVVAFNASTDPLLADIGATSNAAVVTFRAKTAGTGGNAYTLASSNNSRLAVSGATLSGGAAVGNNEFDYTGTDTQTAGYIANAINNSTTALVANHIASSNLAGVVTLSSVAAGDTVTVDTVTLTAVNATPTSILNEFSIASSDTNDATALKNAINGHPSLKSKVVATSSSGVVTVRQLPYTGTTGLAFSSSNNSRLAVTVASGGKLAATSTAVVAAKRKGTSGNAITIASSSAGRLGIASATRLTGGTDTTLTF